MSLTVSVIIVALAYPLAYFLAPVGTKRKYVLLLLLIAPFLTSYLLRVLAWKVILGSSGVFNSLLFWIGLARPTIRSRSSSTASSPSCSCSATSGCRSLHCRSSSRSRASTGACSKRRATSARAGCRRSSGSRSPLRPGRRRGLHVRLHPDTRRVHHPLARRRARRLHVREPDRRPLRHGLSRLATGSVLSLFLLGVVGRLTIVFSRFLQPRQVARTSDGRRDSRERRRGSCGCSSPSSSCSFTRRSCPPDLLVQRLRSARRSLSTASRSTGTTSSSRTPTCRGACGRARSSPPFESRSRHARRPRLARARRRRFRGMAAVSACS